MRGMTEHKDHLVLLDRAMKFVGAIPDGCPSSQSGLGTRHYPPTSGNHVYIQQRCFMTLAWWYLPPHNLFY
jgi:hypothetical protein